MEQIVKILDTWSGTANQLRMRDRSVKVLQYGCQMLLGFYGKKFSNDMQQALALFRRTASTSRKAFWLLKSVNHITNAIHMAQKIMFEFSWVLFFDLMEQVFLALYYVMENIVFFIRVKMISWSEDDVDFGVNWTWFIGDFFCVAAALLRFCESCYNCQNMNFTTNQESLQKYQKLYFDLVGLMIVSLFSDCWLNDPVVNDPMCVGDV